MRIISGKYKGRRFKELNIETTRPTMDRVKESLFGMIQDYISSSFVLDLFAGSGALGLEALSNGADFVYFNDQNIKCVNYIKGITKELDVSNVSFLNKDYKEVLKTLKNNNVKLDIIFLDPPYKLNIFEEIFLLVKEYSLLNDKGIIVCESTNYFETNIYKKIKDRKYGDKYIVIYKNEE